MPQSCPGYASVSKYIILACIGILGVLALDS